MLRVEVDLARGGVQASLSLKQSGRCGRTVRALLDTGSSRMIVRAAALPEPVTPSPKFDAFVHFLQSRLPARVVRLRARVELGGARLGDDEEVELQLAVVSDAPLPHGVDAVIGLCQPAIPAPRCSVFTEAFGLQAFAFHLDRSGGSFVDLRAAPRADAQPLLLADALLSIDPSASNLHYALSTPTHSRVVFDTGAAVSIVPTRGVSLELGGRRLALDAALLWTETGGGVGVVLGMDALRSAGVLHFQRTSDGWAVAVGR